MKRLRRWLFNGLAALSLLFCFAIMVLWVRSYSFFLPVQFGDHLVFRHGQNSLELDSFRGQISLHAPTSVVVANGVWQFTAPREYFGIPHFVASGLLILLPSYWMFGFLRTQPRPRGFCQHCGYDLRATPDRCPECGTIPANEEINSN
jgi:hypothetical protein